jgi:hypothetical protein
MNKDDETKKEIGESTKEVLEAEEKSRNLPALC